MKKTYPITLQLRQAIASLFDNTSMAFGALGLDQICPNDWLEEVEVTKLGLTDRVSLLRRKLESHIINMAKENEELQCPVTTDTLRMQAIGLLVALRELYMHVPEAGAKES